MEYREKILELIFDENDEEAFEKWLLLQSPLEQVDILKELNEIAKELNEEDGDEDARQIIQTLDQKTDEYQEAYLDEKLAELKYDIAVDERDKAFAEADRQVEGIKAYARECIETNAPNADKMREAMVHVIAYEKSSGTYDPATWTWLTNP